MSAAGGSIERPAAKERARLRWVAALLGGLVVLESAAETIGRALYAWSRSHDSGGDAEQAFRQYAQQMLIIGSIVTLAKVAVLAFGVVTLRRAILARALLALGALSALIALGLPLLSWFWRVDVFSTPVTAELVYEGANLAHAGALAIGLAESARGLSIRLWRPLAFLPAVTIALHTALWYTVVVDPAASFHATFAPNLMLATSVLAPLLLVVLCVYTWAGARPRKAKREPLETPDHYRVAAPRPAEEEDIRGRDLSLWTTARSGVVHLRMVVIVRLLAGLFFGAIARGLDLQRNPAEGRPLHGLAFLAQTVLSAMLILAMLRISKLKRSQAPAIAAMVALVASFGFQVGDLIKNVFPPTVSSDWMNPVQVEPAGNSLQEIVLTTATSVFVFAALAGLARARGNESLQSRGERGMIWSLVGGTATCLLMARLFDGASELRFDAIAWFGIAVVLVSGLLALVGFFGVSGDLARDRPELED